MGSVGAAFAAETTGLCGSTTTTIYEAGAWSDIGYHEIEKYDSTLLDELNSAFVRAAVRAEDKKILDLITALTATNFAGDVGRVTGPQAFYAANVAKAIGKLIGAGKEANPGELVLAMSGEAYASLLQELTASQVVAYARDDVIMRGRVEEYLGVTLVVYGSTSHTQQRTNANTGTCDLAFLMRPKKAVVLAPKRDILIETDRQTATRKLRITGSHTFAAKVLDQKSIVRIWCNSYDNTD